MSPCSPPNHAGRFSARPQSPEPNIWCLPVLFHQHANAPLRDDPAFAFEAVFNRNGWPSAWRNSVYPFRHYHSTAHEGLGIAGGTAQLVLGGPGGHERTVRAVDVPVPPAGTNHFRPEASSDFLVVDAYHPDQRPALCRNAAPPEGLPRIASLSFPSTDPVGKGGDNDALAR